MKQNSAMDMELEVISLTEKVFGGASTKIKDILLSYVGFGDSAESSRRFEIKDFKMSTQTLIIKVPSLSFVL